MVYKLKCFNNECSNVREYTNKRSWYNAKRKQSMCLECQKAEISNTLKKKYGSGELQVVPRRKDEQLSKKHFRQCPNCGNKMAYISEGTLHTAIKNNTICNKCSAYKYKKNFKHIITEESILQMRATKAGYSSWEEYLEKYPKKQQYRREVWKLTYRQPLKTLPNWDKRGRCGVDGAYQLDHITSISEGFSKGISPEVLADMSNLRMIPWKENLLKSNKQ